MATTSVEYDIRLTMTLKYLTLIFSHKSKFDHHARWQSAGGFHILQPCDRAWKYN